MKTIAIANHKGGVGKTTTAVNLGAGLAALGKKVLLGDLDPHQNLSMHLGFFSSRIDGVEFFLSGEKSLADIRQSYHNQFDVLPAGSRLANLESRLHQFKSKDPRRYFTLRNTFGKEQLDYDYLILDCPPSLGLLTINAMAFVELVFVPIQCQFFALQGTVKISNLIKQVNQKYNPQLKIGGVIPVMYDSRNKISKLVLNKIKKHFRQQVLDTRIRINTKLAEAPAFQKTIFDYNKNCYGAWDYKQLAREFSEKF